MKIWQQYFLKEVLKSFGFFLLVFYGLYVLIDYSSHASSFHYSHSQFKIGDILTYYTFEFIERMEVLIPFGLLLATIRTLTTLNTHHELIALMASGVKTKALLRPFVCLGLVMVTLMYVNTQFWMPYALQKMNHIDEKHRSKKSKNNPSLSAKSLVLKDKTTILFQNFDSIENKLIDVYWIRDVNDIYHMKYLHPYHETPTGEFVDHFQRQPKGELVISETADQLQFPTMRFHKKDLFQGLIDPEDESVTDLWKKFPTTSVSNEKEAQVVSHFYHKVTMPWLCLLVVVGVAPFCISYQRNIPLFFIYALGIFCLVATYLVFDASLLLGERQILKPWVAIFIPFILCTCASSYKYLRLK